jgi:hypothetical protein
MQGLVGTIYATDIAAALSANNAVPMIIDYLISTSAPYAPRSLERFDQPEPMGKIAVYSVFY